MKPIALQGFLFDKKSSFLRGPALAPPLIRNELYSDAYNPFTELGINIHNNEITDKGDFHIETYFDIEKICLQHLHQGYRLFTWGGDHSITFPIVKAVAQFYSDIHILHIDAHGDLYDVFEGDKHSHACPFARIMENKLATRLIQIGIRTLNPHQKEQAEKFQVEITEMKDFDIQQLPDFQQPIYISLDLDGIDPAFAPGVSHQEAGGLTPREVIKIIHQLQVPIIGADIVEYNPTKDNNGITAALAAKLSKEILGKMLSETAI